MRITGKRCVMEEESMRKFAWFITGIGIIGVVVLFLSYYWWGGRNAPLPSASFTQSRFAYLWKSSPAVEVTHLPTLQERLAIEQVYAQAVRAYLNGDYSQLEPLLASISRDKELLHQKRRIFSASVYRRKKLSYLKPDMPVQVLTYHRVPYSYASYIMRLLCRDEILDRVAQSGCWHPILNRVVVFEVCIGGSYFLEFVYREENGQWRLIGIPLHIFEGMLD